MNLSQLLDTVSFQWPHLIFVQTKCLINIILFRRYYALFMWRKSSAVSRRLILLMLTAVLFPMYWVQIRNGPALKVTRLKGFCVWFFEHCMSSPINIAWSLCLKSSFLSCLELSKTPETTDADGFGSVFRHVDVFKMYIFIKATVCKIVVLYYPRFKKSKQTKKYFFAEKKNSILLAVHHKAGSATNIPQL